MRQLKNLGSYYSISDAIRDIETIYDEFSSRPIERHCVLTTTCCHFLQTGKTPFLTKGEALVALRELRRSGRKEAPKRKDGACRFLHQKTARCLIYQGRPLGCRTHFCQAAGGVYPREAVIDLIHRLEEIDQKLYGSGAQTLDRAIDTALKELPTF